MVKTNEMKTWDEIYMEYLMDTGRGVEIEPLDVEEMNSMWIEAGLEEEREAGMAKTYPDWSEILMDHMVEANPEAFAIRPMSVQALNELYRSCFAGGEKGIITKFPSKPDEVLVDQRKLA